MSNPTHAIPTPSGDLLGGIPPSTRANQHDTQDWQRRCEDLIQERDRLKEELAKTQTERDDYLKTVYHFLCKDYHCPYTSEELLSFVDRDLPIRDFISQMELELETEA